MRKISLVCFSALLAALVWTGCARSNEGAAHVTDLVRTMFTTPQETVAAALEQGAGQAEQAAEALIQDLAEPESGAAQLMAEAHRSAAEQGLSIQVGQIEVVTQKAGSEYRYTVHAVLTDAEGQTQDVKFQGAAQTDRDGIVTALTAEGSGMDALGIDRKE